MKVLRTRRGKSVAAGRSLSWGSAVVGAVLLGAVLLLVAALVIFGGLYPIAASNSHFSGTAWLLDEAMEQSVKRHARGLNAPQATEADITEGAAHYKGMCQQCHGGPGASREEFAEGLNPQPPDLTKGEAAEWSRSEIFWIVKHGIKMTAMSEFGETHSDQDIWHIAAFVKQRLPNVSAADYAAYPTETEQGEDPGEEGHSRHRH